MTAYGKAVGVEQPAISVSVNAWDHIRTNMSCSTGEHVGEDPIPEIDKPTPKVHQKTRNVTIHGERDDAIARALIEAFADLLQKGADTAPATVSRNANWRNRRNAVKAILVLNDPGDEATQTDKALEAAEQIRTEWERIEAALDSFDVKTPSTDAMLDASLARLDREPDFGFRGAVQSEIDDLAAEIEAKRRRDAAANERHSIRWQEATQEWTDIKQHYSKVLSIYDGVEFDDEEVDLLTTDMNHVQAQHDKAIIALTMSPITEE
jgi:hypothetical protein